MMPSPQDEEMRPPFHVIAIWEALKLGSSAAINHIDSIVSLHAGMRRVSFRSQKTGFDRLQMGQRNMVCLWLRISRLRPLLMGIGGGYGEIAWFRTCRTGSCGRDCSLLPLL
ncbi:hypothetical protein HPP92_009480 [Vanilla planifolia]|uniref:Uncharacterized protein n=1 Tax=Vanilla planifolia TaxID=51239 RepID=A0A835R897_VANPL|nr:hypothetical protein HPP92_009480 [Vanilla planifolia]